MGIATFIALFICIISVHGEPTAAAGSSAGRAGRSLRDYGDFPWSTGGHLDADADSRVAGGEGRRTGRAVINLDSPLTCDTLKGMCHNGVTERPPVPTRLITSDDITVCEPVCLQGSPTSCPAGKKPGCLPTCSAPKVVACAAFCKTGRELICVDKCPSGKTHVNGCFSTCPAGQKRDVRCVPA